MQCHSDNGTQLKRDTEDCFLHLFIYQPFLGIKHEDFFSLYSSTSTNINLVYIYTYLIMWYRTGL